MNIVVLGATGNIGTELVQQALQQGHSVTAYVRRPEAVTARAGLTTVGGALDDVAAMARAFAGADAVISCVGGKPGTDFMQQTLPTITAAVKQAGVDRFVLVSAFGVGDTKDKASGFARLIYRTAVKSLFTDKALAEDAVLPRLELNWTVAYPVNLKNGPRLASATVKPMAQVASVPGLPTLPFANVAEALLQIAADEHLAKQRMLITTPNGWRPATASSAR